MLTRPFVSTQEVVWLSPRLSASTKAFLCIILSLPFTGTRRVSQTVLHCTHRATTASWDAAFALAYLSLAPLYHNPGEVGE